MMIQPHVSTEVPMPRPHRGWGGCADELLHYTSRYYPYTEAFLRNLANRRDFVMVGYQAERLTDAQRLLMLAMLTQPPGRVVAGEVTQFIDQMCDGVRDVDPILRQRHAPRLARIRKSGRPVLTQSPERLTLPADLPPLDPFLALVARLGIPTAVDGHRVEVPFEQLARQLDSPIPQVRENLQRAVLWLHDAGYRLYNHPQLTHVDGGR